MVCAPTVDQATAGDLHCNVRSPRPRWYDAADAPVCNGLTEMVVHVGKKLKKHCPLRNPAAVERGQLCQLGLRHAANGLPYMLGGAPEERYDLRLFGDTLEGVPVDIRWSGNAHGARRVLVVVVGNVRKRVRQRHHGGNRAATIRLSGDSLGKRHDLSHRLIELMEELNSKARWRILSSANARRYPDDRSEQND